jgi:TPR repeat protein
MRRLTVGLLLAAASLGLSVPLLAAPDIAALQAKAQAGDPDAEFRMGEAYRSGDGVTADLDSAIMWYRRAAAKGHIRASEELGFALFAHGDRRDAMPYIEKAAARGEPRAFYLLGTAHFNGDYATRDWPLAYAQTERAAAAGLSAAQKNLEVMDHYLLPSDKAKADQILATLPAVRSAPPEAVAAPAPKPAAPLQTASATPKPGKASKPARTSPKSETTAGEKPVPSKPAAKAGGDWKVQLGAFGSEARALARWKTLRTKVADLDSYQQRVVAAGAVQRLQATDIASKADAQALCRKVLAAGGDCLVIAP